jgi:putative ABC transport system permease protein
MASDQFQFPVVIQPRTYAWAGCAWWLPAWPARWWCAGASTALDMVAALKTRD